MVRAPILVDTWALVALTNRADAGRSEAVRVSRQLKAQRRLQVTTEWVLAEFLGSAARPPLRHAAIEIVQQFLVYKRARIVPATSED